jgi:hypothetical protein
MLETALNAVRAKRVGRFKLHLVCGYIVKQLSSRRSLQGAFSVATVGVMHAHLLRPQHKLRDILAPGAVVQLEGAQNCVQVCVLCLHPGAPPSSGPRGYACQFPSPRRLEVEESRTTCCKGSRLPCAVERMTSKALKSESGHQGPHIVSFTVIASSHGIIHSLQLLQLDRKALKHFEATVKGWAAESVLSG